MKIFFLMSHHLTSVFLTWCWLSLRYLSLWPHCSRFVHGAAATSSLSDPHPHPHLIHWQPCKCRPPWPRIRISRSLSVSAQSLKPSLPPAKKNPGPNTSWWWRSEWQQPPPPPWLPLTGAPYHPEKAATEEDDIIGEVILEVMTISLRFTGLPREEITQIFHNKLKAINRYPLRHMRELQYKTFKEEECTLYWHWWWDTQTAENVRDVQRSWKVLRPCWRGSHLQLHYPTCLPFLANRRQISTLPLPSSTAASTSCQKYSNGGRQVLPLIIKTHTYTIAKHPTQIQLSELSPQRPKGSSVWRWGWWGMGTFLGAGNKKRRRDQGLTIHTLGQQILGGSNKFIGKPASFLRRATVAGDYCE